MTEVNNMAVVGAGTMGAGIAHLAAVHGCQVRLIDIDPTVVENGLAGIAKRLARSVEKGRMTDKDRDDTLSRIKPSDRIEDLGSAQLAIEAVVENIKVKHDVFQRLEAASNSTTVLATNTSSLSVSSIAEAVSDASRVVGMHFFNPAPIMPLVEIIAGKESSSAGVDFAFGAVQSWGKTPVKAKDTPGFIVNRVARGFYLEALRLLDEGVGGPHEIDTVMKQHGKFRMGPFELMDLVGLDVNYSVSTSVWEQMGKPVRLTPHKIQRELVEQGRLGRKTGRGFYSYEDGGCLAGFPVERQSFEVSPLLADAILSFSFKAGAEDANSTERYILARILGAIINEAGFAFDEGVASSDDIDTAMIKGTNYPKGPLEWADEIGDRTVRGVLKGLNEQTEDGRYVSAKLFEMT